MITEPNTRTDFFYVDNDYIEYLKRIETENRGYSCVPNVYYWNMLYRQNNMPCRFHRNLPDDIALQIISPEELAFLDKLESIEE